MDDTCRPDIFIATGSLGVSLGVQREKMPAVEESPSERKHTSSSYRDELAHYKAQYEQLEAELADFQSSSRELETELEKDIEASEKRERQLKEKVDTMRYEVDEWKVSN